MQGTIDHIICALLWGIWRASGGRGTSSNTQHTRAPQIKQWNNIL
jgi:hypothetical protein